MRTGSSKTGTVEQRTEMRTGESKTGRRTEARNEE